VCDKLSSVAAFVSDVKLAIGEGAAASRPVGVFKGKRGDWNSGG
jgi:hypothetical protein